MKPGAVLFSADVLAGKIVAPPTVATLGVGVEVGAGGAAAGVVLLALGVGSAVVACVGDGRGDDGADSPQLDTPKNASPVLVD